MEKKFSKKNRITFGDFWLNFKENSPTTNISIEKSKSSKVLNKNIKIDPINQFESKSVKFLQTIKNRVNMENKFNLASILILVNYIEVLLTKKCFDKLRFADPIQRNCKYKFYLYQ